MTRPPLCVNPLECCRNLRPTSGIRQSARRTPGAENWSATREPRSARRVHGPRLGDNGPRLGDNGPRLGDNGPRLGDKGICRARRSRFSHLDSRTAVPCLSRALLCRGCPGPKLLRVVRDAVPPHRVEHPGQPPRQRDRRDPFAAPLRDRPGPRTERGGLGGLRPQDLPRRLDQEPPHPAVARFGDVPELPRLARAPLARHYAQVGLELVGRVKPRAGRRSWPRTHSPSRGPHRARWQAAPRWDHWRRRWRCAGPPRRSAR